MHTPDYISVQIERLDSIILDAEERSQDPLAVEAFYDQRELLIAEQLEFIAGFGGLKIVSR